MKKKATLIAAMLLACGSLAAQTIYRCGNAYSQRPCESGKVIDADDARSAAQARESAARAQSEARLADRMESERLAREKAQAGPSKVVTGERLAPAQASASSAKRAGKKKTKKGAKEPEHFTAAAPRPPAERKKSAKKPSA